MSARPGLRSLAWLAGVAAVAAGVWVSSSKAPRLPADGDHALGQSETRCLTCHGFGQRHPRPADHPLRDDCFSCHRDPEGTLHPRDGSPTELPGGWRDDPRLNPAVRSTTPTR